MRIFKKWYWIGIGCYAGVVRGPYHTKRKARQNAPESPQFKLKKRYPGD